ncbi:MAG TPA: hypothetical protein VIJ19_04060 [Opitutaceae bacterium]
MKSTLTFIAVCIVAYWLYTFYTENPEDRPSFGHRQTNLKSTPIPDEKIVEPLKAPNLDSVVVQNAGTLTHVKVKSAKANSILIACDQGLFDVTYDRLPPEFRAFYMPTPTPSVATDQQATVPTPTPAATSSYKPPVQRTFEEENQARLAYAATKSALEARQQADLDVINKFYKQSNFEPGGLTQTQFDTAKADYDATTAQLGSVVALGP